MKTLTPKQYADLRGITPQAVIKAISKGKIPVGVKRIKKYSRFYLLVMEKNHPPLAAGDSTKI